MELAKLLANINRKYIAHIQRKSPGILPIEQHCFHQNKAKQHTHTHTQLFEIRKLIRK